VLPIKRQARLAGLLYLVLALSAPIGLLYVPGQLLVADDAAATADRLRASAWLLRVGIGSELFHQVVQVYLLLVLYRLFKPVHEGLARQLVVLGALVSVPVVFATVLTELGALLVVSGAPWLAAAFTGPQLDALAYLLLRLHGQGITVVSIFWGLWLFPFGLLVMRSGFIPRVLGMLLLVAGAAYVVAAATAILAPQASEAVEAVTGVLVLGEIPIVFWLAIWGARERAGSLAPA
jgi:uncharacterized membrane protein